MVIMEIYKNLSLEDIHGEIWKRLDIKGFESYLISSYGRIKSLKLGKEKILKQSLTTEGYPYVCLTKNGGGQEKHKIHRLVAKMFIENVENKPYVDHINTIRTDNRVENLRWVTPKENNLNPLTMDKYKRMKPTNYKGYVCVYPNGEVSEDMGSNKMEKFLGIKSDTIIKLARTNEPYRPLSKKNKHLAGIKVYYYQDYLNLSEEDKKKIIEVNTIKKYKYIAVYSDGSTTEEMEAEELGKLLNVSASTVRNIAKGRNHFESKDKRTKHLNGICIYNAEDYLKLESGDNNVA